MVLVPVETWQKCAKANVASFNFGELDRVNKQITEAENAEHLQTQNLESHNLEKQHLKLGPIAGGNNINKSAISQLQTDNLPKNKKPSNTSASKPVDNAQIVSPFANKKQTKKAPAASNASNALAHLPNGARALLKYLRKFPKQFTDDMIISGTGVKGKNLGVATTKIWGQTIPVKLSALLKRMYALNYDVQSYSDEEKLFLRLLQFLKISKKHIGGGNGII